MSTTLQISQQKTKINHLDTQRKVLESQILESQENESLLLGPNYEIGCKLIDSEGFPLQVDVYTITHLRAERLKKLNDLKAINQDLEQQLLHLHTLLNSLPEEDVNDIDNHNDSHDTNHSTQQSINSSNISPITSRPILRIDLVVDNSPAQEAGLQNGDQIIKFGTITNENFYNEDLSPNLTKLTSLVTQSENHDIEITYLHHSTFSIQTTILKPHIWSGPGLLGCKVIPL